MLTGILNYFIWPTKKKLLQKISNFDSITASNTLNNIYLNRDTLAILLTNESWASVCKLKISSQSGEIFPNRHIGKEEQFTFLGKLSTFFRPERAHQKNPFLLALFFTATQRCDHACSPPQNSTWLSYAYAAFSAPQQKHCKCNVRAKDFKRDQKTLMHFFLHTETAYS